MCFFFLFFEFKLRGECEIKSSHCVDLGDKKRDLFNEIRDVDLVAHPFGRLGFRMTLLICSIYPWQLL